MYTHRQQLHALIRGVLLACSWALCSACTTTSRHAISSGAQWENVRLRPNTVTDVLQGPDVMTRFARIRVVRDTLYGWRSPFRRDRGDSVAIPLARIYAIHQLRTSWGRTMALILGTFAVVIGYFAAVLYSVDDY
jgi:hypothetical protein